MSTAQAYPLTWPDGFPRTRHRESGRFKTTLAGALKNVRDSLRLFAVDSGKKLDALVISSNVTLGETRPADCGVAVWFVWDGLQVCIPVDRYQTVEGNLQAIHHIIEARRVELRHGGLAIVRATFTGFLSLPAPKRQSWFDVLEVEDGATLDICEAAYRAKAKRAHPDAGGSADQMAALNAAIAEARKVRA